MMVFRLAKRDSLSNSTSVQPPVTSDTITRLLEDPFGSWHTTLAFVVLLFALGSCAILLGSRYAEILRFDAHSHDELPLTLNRQRPNRSGNDAGDPGSLFEETATSQVTHSQDGHQFDLRRRPGTATVQPGYVAIGEVREGMIAQRRASFPRGARRVINVPGYLALKPSLADDNQSLEFQGKIHGTV
ncbi:hypothetical protein AYL99_05157 [Fonsecaea erecta]|uniref:Uncharacterized protein n=1 Tax=Fonsecaea erecta TaxID=1367422 RepID=A0A178ZMB0_9EURO|nr:hypothetical protein AYL99_05157 [Fonsecaea erecta]OAP60155.1 hypothetical protein AYL99_05157 [Fonsecaea erecta]